MVQVGHTVLRFGLPIGGDQVGPTVLWCGFPVGGDQVLLRLLLGFVSSPQEDWLVVQVGCTVLRCGLTIGGDQVGPTLLWGGVPVGGDQVSLYLLLGFVSSPIRFCFVSSGRLVGGPGWTHCALVWSPCWRRPGWTHCALVWFPCWRRPGFASSPIRFCFVSF